MYEMEVEGMSTYSITVLLSACSLLYPSFILPQAFLLLAGLVRLIFH